MPQERRVIEVVVEGSELAIGSRPWHGTTHVQSASARIGPSGTKVVKGYVFLPTESESTGPILAMFPKELGEDPTEPLVITLDPPSDAAGEAVIASNWDQAIEAVVRLEGSVGALARLPLRQLVRRTASPSSVPSHSPNRVVVLAELLGDLFPTGVELQHFLLKQPGGRELAGWLNFNLPTTALALESAVKLESRGMVDGHLFDALRERDGGQNHARIAHVRSLHLGIEAPSSSKQVAVPVEVSRQSGPLRVLVLASNPLETPRLAIDQELAEIRRTLESAGVADRVQFDIRFDVRVNELQLILASSAPQVVHFCGHGVARGGLVLKNRAGDAYVPPPEALATTFELLRGVIQLVILDACHQDDQARAIARAIPFTVGTTRFITDNHATEFSCALYLWLAKGQPLGEAYKRASNALHLSGMKPDTYRLVAERVGADPARWPA